VAIIALKAWYLEQYEPIKKVIQKPCNLRLSRNSLLKTGLRADFLDDRFEVESSDWFELYLEGRTVEFYIQGSGNYLVANIDLVSQEIYFTKCHSISGLEPIIYYSPQSHYQAANEAITDALNNIIAQIAERSRIPLSLEVTPRSSESPLRLSNSQFRKINKSLLLIADVTPISTSLSEKQSSLLVDPTVCVELGYGIQNKDNGQILLINMERPELEGTPPFDMANYKQLSFTDAKQLAKSLPKLIDTLLQRYSLF
jgi:predicted Zn-ribbon and HTH transcriptional regulator